MNWYKKAQNTIEANDLESIVINDEISDMMTLKEKLNYNELRDGYYVIGNELFKVSGNNIQLVNNVVADFQWGEGGWNLRFKENSSLPSKEIMDKLKNTKVIDIKTGLPLLMHHGTQSQFDSFDTNYDGRNFPSLGNIVKGFYFTPDYEEAVDYSTFGKDINPTVISAWLNIENPIYRKQLNSININESDKSLTNALIKQGYDGYILNNNFGQIIEAAVFDNSQIFRKE